ncbi:MAG: phage holin family protein [Alistipes sp.]|nr:phage holin family protein [Alistipes sp.]MBQ4127942.1 phage holin family protein [Alistipes sp.]
MEALCRYINGCAAGLVALFAPVVPLVWCVVGFIGFDFVTGVLASRADARRAGEEWYLESREAWRTVEKLGFTVVALCMAYTIDVVLLDFLRLNLTRLFAGFVCGVEMWSFIENACRISDAPLLRHIRRVVRQRVRKEVERR